METLLRPTPRCHGRGPTAIAALGLALTGLFAAALHAATFCVHSSAQFQSALSSAENNNQDDVIKVAEDSYNAPSGGFHYATFAQPGDDYHDLEISGGWYDLFNFACLGHHNTPFQTVLNGSGTGPVMSLIMRAQSNVTVRFLTFTGGNAGDEAGGGLSLFAGDAGYQADWIVESNAFIANNALFAGGLNASGNQTASTAHLKVANNLFLLNHGTQGSGAAELVLDNAAGIYFTNNTVLANSSDFLGFGAVYLATGNAYLLVANNNFRDNDNDDIYATADGSGYGLLHNNYQSRGGSLPTQSEGNINVDPQYQHGPLFDYTPARNSPLVDAGFSPSPFAPWHLSDSDLEGAERTVGQVDIGAYEEERIFADGFDPPPLF